MRDGGGWAPHANGGNCLASERIEQRRFSAARSASQCNDRMTRSVPQAGASSSAHVDRPLLERGRKTLTLLDDPVKHAEAGQ